MVIVSGYWTDATSKKKAAQFNRKLLSPIDLSLAEDHPHQNFIIATGTYTDGYALCVVDFDGHSISFPAIKSLFPKTRCVQTGSGGIHLYYKVRCAESEIPRNSQKLPLTDLGKTMAENIDIRGFNGIVFAPPSLFTEHIRRYTYLLEIEPTELTLAQWQRLLEAIFATPTEFQVLETAKLSEKPSEAAKPIRPFFQQLLDGKVDLMEVMKRSGLPEHVIWLSLWRECRCCGIFPDTVHAALAASQPEYDREATIAQLQSPSVQARMSKRPSAKLYRKLTGISTYHLDALPEFPSFRFDEKGKPIPLKMIDYMRIIDTEIVGKEVCFCDEMFYVLRDQIWVREDADFIYRKFHAAFPTLSPQSLYTLRNHFKAMIEHKEINNIPANSTIFNAPGPITACPPCLPHVMPTPNWTSFITQIAGNEYETLMSFLHYYLTASLDIQQMLILVGPPACGKTLLGDLMHEMLGDLAFSNVNFDSFVNDDKNVAVIRGKFLAVFDETKAITFRPSAIELLKSISTSRFRTDRGAYEKLAMWRNTARFLFLCNDLPISPDLADAAFYERFCILRLQPRKGEIDPDLFLKLKAELPGIMQQILDHPIKLAIRGNAVETYRMWQTQTSPEDRFLNLLTDNHAEDQRIPFSEIYLLYEKWAKAAGASTIISKNALARKAKHYEIEKARDMHQFFWYVRPAKAITDLQEKAFSFDGAFDIDSIIVPEKV